MATKVACDKCKQRHFSYSLIVQCLTCRRNEDRIARTEWENANRVLVSEMTSRSTSKIAELETQSKLLVEGLKAQSRTQIEELEAQSRLQIENLQARLNFLQLRFDNEQAAGIGKIIVTGDAEDQVLYCHEFILAARSPVFCTMIEREMLKGGTVVIRIEEATFPVVSAVIKFCHIAEINFSEDVTSEEVLAVAHRYAIDALFKICEDHLTKSIDHVNLPRRLKVAKKFGAKGLQAVALEYLKKHFDEVIVTAVDDLF